MGELTRILSDAGRNSDIPLVWNAFEVAKDAHRGQKRTNGERYITHPVEVATIVARHGGTGRAVCAALLHDVIEDAAIPSSRLHSEFGREIATMVDDVTSRAIRSGSTAKRELALVTVADRLHNLQTLHRTSREGRQRASLDTLVFHVPLARQINLPTVAAEMTDLACTALGSLDRRDLTMRLSGVTDGIRKIDVRRAVETAAALGGGAAIVNAEAIPEWALATGAAGILAVMTAALFGRDPRAAKRLAQLIKAWRRGDGG